MASPLTTSNIHGLPLDMYSSIFSHLPHPTLKSCRLASRALSLIATPRAFHHIYLTPSIPKSVAAFINIAQSPVLRSKVIEITVDTWLGPHFRYNANEDFQWPISFLRALPYLRLFSGVKTLNVRFAEWCGNEDRNEVSFVSVDETYDFRYRVLGTIFDCAAGIWNERKQSIWDDVLQSEYETQTESNDNSSKDEETPNEMLAEYPTYGMPTLKTLTISNLAGYNDRRLTESNGFKKVMHSPSLKELKLMVTAECDEASPEHSLSLPEQYVFFRTLSETWLSPPVAKKLEVLSLYFKDYWGWAPRAEFRGINPGSGPEDPKAGFPHLRVLALGNYVFSHDWQIDWIASLGKENGHGGLQELYLDDCPILWCAVAEGPLDDGTITIMFDNDEADEETGFEVSNQGYPRENLLTGSDEGVSYQGDVKRTWDTRWCEIINQWRETMPALRTFKMGHGNWNREYLDLVTLANEPLKPQQPVFGENVNSQPMLATEDGAAISEREFWKDTKQNYERQRREYELKSHRYNHCVHVNYDRPAPPLGYGSNLLYPGEDESIYDGLTPEGKNAQIAARLKDGAGLRQKRVDMMQYVKFDCGLGPSQWLPDEYFDPDLRQPMEEAVGEEGLEEFEKRMPEYRDVMKKDDEALEKLNAVLAERNLVRR